MYAIRSYYETAKQFPHVVAVHPEIELRPAGTATALPYALTGKRTLRIRGADPAQVPHPAIIAGAQLKAAETQLADREVVSNA